MSFFAKDDSQDQANVEQRPMFPPKNPTHPAKRQLVERGPPTFSPASLHNEVNRSQVPPNEWKRLRIAMTQAEFDAFRAWWFETKDSFPHTVCGIKIVIEDRPTSPVYSLEYRE